MQSATRLFRAFLVITLTASAFVHGQDEQPQVPPADESKLSAWDRLIYVPFKELQKVLDNQEASAVIPYAEYLELMQAYLNRDAANGTSPDAVITRSSFDGTVDKDVVRIDAVFTVNVLKEEGWARLPIHFGQAAIGKVTTDEPENVILKGVSQGRYELLLQGKGEHQVTLQLLATVKTSPENRSFALECPTVGISELTLTIPKADQSIEISPLQVLLPVDGSDNQKTVVKASLGAIEQFEVRWNPKAGSRPVMDLLASVTNHVSTRLEAGLAQSTASLNYEVLRGELTEVTVLVPADARVIDVVSSNGRIGNWKPEAVGETHQRIQVELLTPATDAFQLTVQTERTTQGNTYQLVGRSDDGKLQGIHAEGVVRESGQIILTNDPSLTTLVQNQSGVKRIDAGNGGKGDSSTRQAWEFSGTTGTLIVETKPVQPRLLVQQASQIVFDDDELRLSTRLTYTVERAGVFQLNLQYPESLTIDQVRADGMSEFSVDKEAGELTLSLTQKRLGQINVDITAHQAFDAAAENADTEIPTVTPIGVEREDGRIALFAPRFLDVATNEEKTNGVFAAEPNEAANVGRAVRTASWKYTQRPFTLAVSTSPRPAQLAASVATTVDIQPERVEVASRLRFTIRNAGIDTFRVAVPEELANKAIGFTSGNPQQYRIQQTSKSQTAEDGWVTWTLVLQDEMTGVVEIVANWTTSLEEFEGEGAEQSVAIDPIRILPPYTDEQADKRKVSISETRGEVSLVRHESLSIAADSPDESMEKIDVRELQLLPQQGYLAFRYFEQPATANVTIRKHEIHAVVATVVSRSAVEVVTDQQSLATIRARFRVKTSHRQRLRIDLPAGADLQSPLLNDSRTTLSPSDAETMDGWDAYDINISRDGSSDEEFLLTLQFTCRITESGVYPYDGQGRKQILRLPVIGDASGGTVVQESRVAVWCPKEISFVGEPTHWSIVGRSSWSILNPMVSPSAVVEAERLNDWIGSSSGSGDFARQGNVTVYRALGRQPQINVVWWNRPFLVAIISGALLFVGFILRRTSWENRLTLVIVGCVAFALWSLKDQSEAMQFLSAGSLSLIAVAGIWITQLFLGTGEPDQVSPLSNESPPTTGPPTVAPPSTLTTPSGPAVNMTGAQGDPPLQPGTVSPSPGVIQWMNDIMGGKV